MEETQRPTAKPSSNATPHGPRGSASTSMWWDSSSVPPAMGSTIRADSTTSTVLGQSAAQQPLPQAQAPSSCCSGFGSMTTAVQRALEQCEARGINATAQWLGELLLSASPQFLEQTSSNYPLIPPSPVLEGQTRTMASLGRLLLQNREYLRCHELLKASIPGGSSSAAAAALDGSQRHGSGGSLHPRYSGTTHGAAQPTRGGRSVSSIRPSEGPADWGGGLMDDEPTFPHDMSTFMGTGATPTASVRPYGGMSSLSMPSAAEGWRPRLSGDAASVAAPSSLRGPSVASLEGASPIPSTVHPQVQHNNNNNNNAHPPNAATMAGGGGAHGNVLRESTTVVFIALYALYLDGQRQRSLAPIASRSQPNPNLRTLRLLLQPTLDAFPYDPYLLWLHAVVLRDAQLKQEAATLLVQAVRLHPFLWCAWQDLATLVTRESQLSDIASALRVQCRTSNASSAAQPPAGTTVRPDTQLMFNVFAAMVRGDLGYHTVAVDDWDELLEHFPTSSFIRCHIGSCMYNRKDFDRARCVFEEVQQSDPFRIEGTDEYSNVLFVRGDRAGLSKLAQHCYGLDPYRSETNCIVGNYYAMSGRHDKSLFYFKRAVTIDPLYLSGWTLMGHEYLEMKNTAAAVEAYRAAVEIDQRDYRAWYGLGQIYELLHMYHHAVYYYWQTTTLRPTDPRMWTAVANCLEQDRRPHEAIACLERGELYEPSISEHYPQLVRRVAEYFLDEANNVAPNRRPVGRQQQRSSRNTTTAHPHDDKEYRGVGGGGESGGGGGGRAAMSFAAARAVTYLEKLIQCERRKPDDLLFAIPALTETYLHHIHEAFNIPTRSPSFDPSYAHMPYRNSGGDPAGGLETNSSIAIQEAYQTLTTCENYLSLMLRTVPMHGNGEDESDATGGDGGGLQHGGGGGREGGSGGGADVQYQQASVSRYVSQAQSSIQYIRSYLNARSAS